MTDTRLGKVAVLLGGNSAEREISLMSGQGVLDALRSRGVDAHPFDPAQREISELRRDGFTCCFIALHGRYGEDGTVQGALELLGIPYTGSGVMASSIAMDKVMTKRLWLAQGLPTPDYVVLSSPHQEDSAQLASLCQSTSAQLGLPLIVKPPHEGSSIGVSKVAVAADLPQALRLSAGYEPEVLCEAFVDGEELTCALLGTGAAARALPLVRIQAPQGAYDYQNKYFTDLVKYQCPSGLPAQEEAEIARIALAAYRGLGCRGWARADLMLRASDRRVFLLEMNTAPGMTSHSLVPMSARAAGLDYPDLCLEVLRLARLDYQPAAGASRGPVA